MPNLLKKCTKCGEMRDETEFHFNGQHYSDGIKRRRTDCVYCARKIRREYFKNPDKKTQINKRRRRNYQTDGGARKERNRRNALMQNYGITVEQYDEIRMSQNYCCAICKIHETKATRQKLYVDHSHITGQNRGLLCATCNSAIGLLKENVETIGNAILYLKSKK